MTEKPNQKSELQKTAGKLRHEREKLIASSQGLLLSEGKSKRLTAMRNKIRPTPATSHLPFATQEIIPGLSKEVATQLEEARKAINNKIIDIMNRYPPGKKHKMFAIKYGAIDKIPTLSIKQAFMLLGIHYPPVKKSLIADLDYFGNDTRTNR